MSCPPEAQCSCAQTGCASVKSRKLLVFMTRSLHSACIVLLMYCNVEFSNKVRKSGFLKIEFKMYVHAEQGDDERRVEKTA